MEISWCYLVDFGVKGDWIRVKPATRGVMEWTGRDSLFAKWRERNYLGLLTGDEVSGEEFKGRALIFLTFSLGELLLKVKDKHDLFTHHVTGSNLEPSTLGSSTLKVACAVLNSVDYSTSSRSNFFLCLKNE